MTELNDLNRSDFIKRKECQNLFVDIKNHWAQREIDELTKRQIIQQDNAALFQPEMKMTTETFITWVVRSVRSDQLGLKPSDYIDYASQKGLIEDYDRINREQPMERRQAARIVHDTLRFELKEKDESDWTVAKKLKDLYSCRTCVQHITQVFVKGIMNPDQPNLFNVTGHLTRAKTAVILFKMLDRTARTPQIAETKKNYVELEPEQARELLMNDKAALLYDVRPIESYKNGHLEGSYSLPLEMININPVAISDDKKTPIILYCQKGYSSALAAEHLIESGYKKVYTIPGIMQYPYTLVD